MQAGLMDIKANINYLRVKNTKISINPHKLVFRLITNVIIIIIIDYYYYLSVLFYAVSMYYYSNCKLIFGRYLIWIDFGLPNFWGGGGVVGSVTISLRHSRLELTKLCAKKTLHTSRTSFQSDSAMCHFTESFILNSVFNSENNQSTSCSLRRSVLTFYGLQFFSTNSYISKLLNWVSLLFFI